MTSSMIRTFVLRTSVALNLVGLAALSGCGFGTLANPTNLPLTAQPVSGTIYGGPNPVVGARVIMYATTATGYGQGVQLAEAQQVGSQPHQDTDAFGSFSFAGGYTCPAGAYAYIVAYGGNSGAGNNPNITFMSALGACSSLFSGTTYTGGNIFINELTTVVAAYTLNNFMAISGDAVHGYRVDVGSDAGNAAATGCVANAYYGSGCATTQAAGMAHAFALAAAMVNGANGKLTSAGGATGVTANGAILPTQMINALGNIVMACVNSQGGGTDPVTGYATTTTSGYGTSHDGTICGRLSAYTSYTSTGQPGAPLTAAGQTLGMMQNLARRPTGSASTWDSNCDSNTGLNYTTNTSVNCMFALLSPQPYYSPGMTAAPPDWMIAITYPKGALSKAANTTSGCNGSPTTLGLLYPYAVATDINDDLVILNGDGASNTCYNLLSIGFDGTPLGASTFDNSGFQLGSIANDSFGHTIVPVHTSGATGGAVRIYATGTDSNIALLSSQTATQTTPLAVAAAPVNVVVDGTDNLYVNGQAGTPGSDFGYLKLSGANSHSAPSYTPGSLSSANAELGLQLSADLHGNIFQASTASGRPYFTSAGGTSLTEAPSTATGGGTTANGFVQAPDALGNVWIAYTAPGTPSPGSPLQDIAFQIPYTVASGTPTWGSTTVFSPTPPAQVFPANDFKLTQGVMDGSNILWWADAQGSASSNGVYGGYLHAFDTVRQYFLPTFYGCQFTTLASGQCGSQPSDSSYPSSYPYAFYGAQGIAIDSAGNLWSANGPQGHLTEVIGIAAPTWPSFIHNGVSIKP
jgi:hypothetical protein